jgi:hypothetical protein
MSAKIKLVSAGLLVAIMASSNTQAIASENLGGYAVIDPNTGVVYGVIVGDWDKATFEQVKAERTWDGYMGCPSPCELVLQTDADENGNVAGYHGTTTQVDADGSATQSNTGEVVYDRSSDTFDLGDWGTLKAGSKPTEVVLKTKCIDENYGITWRAKKRAIWDESETCISAKDVKKIKKAKKRGNK